jgi:hypothetical protein
MHQSYDDLWFKAVIEKTKELLPSFEDLYPIIEKEIEKRRCRWNLSAVPYINFDDVKQILLLHIYQKWYQYDSSRPIEPWASRIILNQIKNLLRNHYYTYAKICKNCVCSMGDDHYCTLFGSQDPSKCLVLNKWQKNKSDAFNVKVPVSAENHEYEIVSKTDSVIDISKALSQFDQIFKKKLTTYEYKVFRFVFVQHIPDEKTIEKLGYKIDKDKGYKSTVGYKIVHKAKKRIMSLAKELTYNGEIEVNYE